MEELDYRIALGMLPGMKPSIISDIYDSGLSAKEFLTAEREELLQRTGTDYGAFFSREQKDKAIIDSRTETEYARRYGIRIYTYRSPGYPERLSITPDAPLVIYVMGTINMNHGHWISIVGTRRCTSYGGNKCASIIADLAETTEHLTVVSGLASGIDTCAHENALKHHIPTVAVVGHGLGMIYPACNRPLAKQIIDEGGAIISEYPFSRHPDKHTFLERNRIIAGLSDMTLLIESDIRGGAMSTARLAFDYDREVAAIPGRAGDPESRGCNYLIKKQIASLIEDTSDIADIMRWNTKSRPKIIKDNLFTPQDGPLKTIYEIMRQRAFAMTLDELAESSGLPAGQLNCMLTDMECDGLISRLPGNRFAISRK